MFLKQNILFIIKLVFLILFSQLNVSAFKQIADDHLDYEITKNVHFSRLHMNLGKDSLRFCDKILRSRFVKISSYDIKSLVKLGYLRRYYYDTIYVPAKVLKTVQKSITEDLKFYDDCLAGVYGEDFDPTYFDDTSHKKIRKKIILRDTISKKILAIDANIQRKIRKELFNYCVREYLVNNKNNFLIPWYKANYYRNLKNELNTSIEIMFPD